MKPQVRGVIIVFFLVLIFVVFLLPFRVESIHSTVYTNILGKSQRATPEVNYYNAYQEIYVIGLQLFYFATLALVYFGKNKIWGIFTMISSVVNAISLFVIYFALTFHLNFFGPSKTMEAGHGFYLLCLLSCLLIIFSVSNWFYLPQKVSQGASKDLLDADF